MPDMEFMVLDEPGLGHIVRRYRVACDHGVSSALLLPGRRPLPDLAVLDFLLAGHHSKQRCRCVPGLPVLATEARA